MPETLPPVRARTNSEGRYTYAQALKQARNNPKYELAERHFLALSDLHSHIGVLRSRLGADSRNPVLVAELAEFYLKHGDFIDAYSGLLDRSWPQTR